MYPRAPARKEKGPTMDLYHVWCDLKPGLGDVAFAQNIAAYMEHLSQSGSIAGWRLTRRKLGLGLPELGEFHLMIEVVDLAQLDQAFTQVAARRDPTESRHFDVNSMVVNARFALYRDFPDTFRHRGEERF